MADTRYVEQTLYELERALNDLVDLGLLPAEAARAVLDMVKVSLSQEVDHGSHTTDESL